MNIAAAGQAYGPMIAAGGYFGYDPKKSKKLKSSMKTQVLGTTELKKPKNSMLTPVFGTNVWFVIGFQMCFM